MLALPAGNDVEMGGGSFSFKTIPQLVQSGRLSIDVVDRAVSRVLRAKFAMGLFEQPYRGVDSSDLPKHMHTPEAVKLARQLDAESIVLMENRNNVLPLKQSANIAIIGPMADFMNVSLAIPMVSLLQCPSKIPQLRIITLNQVSMSINFCETRQKHVDIDLKLARFEYKRNYCDPWRRVGTQICRSHCATASSSTQDSSF